MAQGKMRSSAQLMTGQCPIEQRRKGGAVMEFAILAPFLATLVVGMFELGRTVMIKDLLTDAARKACRSGVTYTGTYQNLINDVNDILSDNNIPAADATITVQVAPYTGSGTTPCWGGFNAVSGASSYNPKKLDKVSVKVAIPVTDVLWFSPVFTPKSSIESETLIMLRQG
jgi:Flp pilus assembly protein TadG